MKPGGTYRRVQDTIPSKANCNISMNLSVCLPTYLFVYVPIFILIYLSISIYLSPPTPLTIFISLYILFLHLRMHVSISLYAIHAFTLSTPIPSFLHTAQSPFSYCKRSNRYQHFRKLPTFTI